MLINFLSESKMGVEISEIDVSILNTENIQKILDLVYKYKLLVFRKQNMSKAAYVEFARKLGQPQIYPNPNYHHPEYPEIFVSSNIPEKGKKVGVAGAGSYWHTDCQFTKKPLPLTLIFPQIFSPKSKRGTMFIDMARIYQLLPEYLKITLDGVYGINEGKMHYKVQAHDIDKSIKQIIQEFESWAPSVRHPAIIEHPKTKEKSLYISSGFTTSLENFSNEESKTLLQEIFQFIEKAENIYKHFWCQGDLLLWDNRTLLHKAFKSDSSEKSSSYRIGVFDGLPFY